MKNGQYLALASIAILSLSGCSAGMTNAMSQGTITGLTNPYSLASTAFDLMIDAVATVGEETPQNSASAQATSPISSLLQALQ